MSAPIIKVYAGLSVGSADVQRVLPGARFAEPVKRGDIPKDVADGVGVIVIVDGRFMQNLAVTPGELMDALRRGTRLYGCSSMGAMRAVELEPYGMIGHGEIFQHIRQTPYFGDDLLGLTFREDTLEPLTVPFVDLHFSLRDLRRRGKATTAQVKKVQDVFLALPFPDRTLRHVTTELARIHGRRADVLCSLAKVALGRARQKRLDALGTLARVKSDLRAVKAANRRLEMKKTRS